jgi:pimeloyl-ACP methyl ester carboxylesterase
MSGLFLTRNYKMKTKELIKTAIALYAGLALISSSALAQTNKRNNRDISNSQQVHYRTILANGLHIFYREAGPKDAPTILLLHGYPTSSHMYRNLIPILSKRYHVLAPDLPGFGYSDAPEHTQFKYTFENLAGSMQSFINELGVKRFAIYVFDYGAPVGLRLALSNPEKITGIISQNGNAYEEGLSTGWNPIQRYWKNPSPANRDSLRMFMTDKITWFQYHQGVADSSLIAPESYTLDQHFLDRPGNVEIQLDLMLDYRTNVALYPKFQAYFRAHKPRLLAVWGNKDPYFLPAGAEAYKRDNPNATVKFYDTGHFALETNVNEIGQDILNFLNGLPR